jgi:hypothetical protein
LGWPNRFSPSSREILAAAGLIVAATAVGRIAWSGEVLALPAAILFPMLWAFAPTRLVSALVSMAYFLAASRDLPQGASTYLEINKALSVALWLAASASFVLLHTVLWTSKPRLHRALRYGLAALAMSVPPFGITGWASPITAAGVLFPGWGWFGLVVTTVGLIVMTTQFRLIASLIFLCAWTWSAASWTPPSAPDGWIGINTSFNNSDKAKTNGFEQQRAIIAMVRKAASEGYSVIVLPESAFGTWTPTTEHLWMKSLANTDAAVIGGAAVLEGAGYDNVVVEATSKGSKIIYRQRMPVPGAMWRPWTVGGASAGFFKDPVMEINGTRIAPLICYEQLIVWPLLQSMLPSPDMIVAITNGWWTGGTKISSIQEVNVEAWAELFDVTLVMAINVLADDLKSTSRTLPTSAFQTDRK